MLVSGGYPGEYTKGKRIEIGEIPSGEYRHTKTAFHSLVFAEVVVFHCGTSLNGDELVTAGGRVLAVSAVAPSLEDALASVYAAIDKISFEGMVYRRDIAHRQAKFLLVGLAMLMLLVEHWGTPNPLLKASRTSRLAYR